jgi:hypothetical protein
VAKEGRPWGEMRVRIADMVSQISNPVLDREQQGRLALGWPRIYLAGKSSTSVEEDWRVALGYTPFSWAEVCEVFELAIPNWRLPMLTAEHDRQAEVSAIQAANVSHRKDRQPPPTAVNGGLRNGTTDYLAVAVASAVEESKSTHLSPDGDVRVLSLNLPKKKRQKRPLADKDWIESFHEHFWPWWLRVGRSCSKADAFVAWCKVPAPQDAKRFNRLMDAAEAAHALWLSEQRPVAKFPHASTWLNDYIRNLELEAAS